MKLAEINNIINSEIAWICITASAMNTGAVTLQIEQTESGIDVTLSKSGDGTGFDSSEEKYTDIRLSEVLERIMKINTISLVEESENSYSFDDDAEISGTEYEISFGVDEYIIMSINGCDFQSKSVNLFLKVITSMFTEGSSVLEFIAKEY